MPEYTVQIKAYVSGVIRFTARSDEEAERMFDEGRLDYPMICAQCSGWNRSYSIEFDDWEHIEHDSEYLPNGEVLVNPFISRTQR